MQLEILKLDAEALDMLTQLNEANPNQLTLLNAVEYDVDSWFLLPEVKTDDTYLWYRSFLNTLPQITIDYGGL